MPRRADHQKADHRSNDQRAAPNEISFCSSASSQPDAHSHKDEEVVQVVADSLQPTSEIAYLQLETSNLAITSIENACPVRDKSPPITMFQ